VHHDRSDPRERRRWLRGLDFVLTDEIRDAGALSSEELMQMSAEPLRQQASRETIEEWWEYAQRRGWLEEHEAGRCRLTNLGREEVREIRRRGRRNRAPPSAMGAGHPGGRPVRWRVR